MIAFRGLRGGGVAPAMWGPRQAAVTPAVGREKTTLRAALHVLTLSSRGPRDGPSITADHAPGLRELATPSDVPSSYESKYKARAAWLSNGRTPVG